MIFKLILEKPMNDYIDRNLWAKTHFTYWFPKIGEAYFSWAPIKSHEQAKLYIGILQNRFEELSTQYSFLAGIADI